MGKVSSNEAWRLMHVNSGIEMTMKKGITDVKLMNFDSSKLVDKAEGVLIVYAKLLMKTFGY